MHGSDCARDLRLVSTVVSTFELSEELEALRASVRRLAETGIAPHARQADETESFPTASWKIGRAHV